MKLLPGLVACTLIACGGNGGGTGGGAGGGAGGGGAGGGSGAPTCSAYCTAIMSNCTGINQQYSQLNRCQNACKAFPVGASADTSGNTLGCRQYHAGAAASAPATHCVHAGPGGAGTCGADCDGYCQMTQLYCTTANQALVYADLPACKAHCAMFGTTAKYSTSSDAGIDELKQVACLLYHAQEGTTAPVDHCLGDLAKPPDGGISTTCNL